METMVYMLLIYVTFSVQLVLQFLINIKNVLRKCNAIHI